MRFTPADHAILRRGLLRRGHSLSVRLSDLMKGKDGGRIVDALGLLASPGATPAETLRRALTENEQMRAWLDADDPQYGRCGSCERPFSVEELREVPWADRCREHAGNPPAAH